MNEVIKKSGEIVEVGGKKYPLWEIVRVGEKLYPREIDIFAGIDGKKIPATSMNDDWLHAGRLKEKAGQGDEERRGSLKKWMPLFTPGRKLTRSEYGFLIFTLHLILERYIILGRNSVPLQLKLLSRAAEGLAR